MSATFAIVSTLATLTTGKKRGFGGEAGGATSSR